MIKLDVQEYCQECPYFDAVVVPGYCNMAIGVGAKEMVPSGDVLIKCKSWHVCERAVDMALKLKEAEK